MAREQVCEELVELVRRAQRGDVEACGRLVERTQAMVFAVACRVLRDGALAEDAAQEAYLRAFRRLGDLAEPAAFAGWLRRIAVTTALNLRRARRGSWLCLDDGRVDVPVLDELETRWSDAQRLRLGAALLTLSRDERRLCDRRYHGGWSIGRLAHDAGVDEAAMRKRLQRLRDKLRKEIEMSEQQEIRLASPAGLPRRIVELLASPQLTHVPENPVGWVTERLRAAWAECGAVELPEMVDMPAARASLAADAIYVDLTELQHVDERRILRYDLTLPLLLHQRSAGAAAWWAEGKVYRRCQADAQHLEAFHQAEVFQVIPRESLDAWRFTGRVLQSVDAVLPNATVRIVPTAFPMCRQAWELAVEVDGRASEVLAWGVFTDAIVRQIGADPARYAAIGAGYGLERLASLRYGIDDVRKVEAATVTQ